MDNKNPNGMSSAANNDSVKEMMLSHLTEKYDVEFICESFAGKALLSSTYNMVAYPQNGDNTDSFSASYDPGTEKISDGYYGVIVRSEIGQTLSAAVSPILGEHKLFIRMNSTFFQDDLTRGVSAKEAVSHGQDMSLTVSIFAVNKTEVFNFLKSKLQELNYSGIVQYYSLNDSSALEATNNKSFPGTIASIQSGKVSVGFKASESF